MLFTLILLACRPSPFDSEAWVDLYIDGYCGRNQACGGAQSTDYVHSYAYCEDTLRGWVVAPYPDCVVNTDVVEACLDVITECDIPRIDPCGYAPSTFWSCPSAT